MTSYNLAEENHRRRLAEAKDFCEYYEGAVGDAEAHMRQMIEMQQHWTKALAEIESEGVDDKIAELQRFQREFSGDAVEVTEETR